MTETLTLINNLLETAIVICNASSNNNSGKNPIVNSIKDFQRAVAKEPEKFIKLFTKFHEAHEKYIKYGPFCDNWLQKDRSLATREQKLSLSNIYRTAVRIRSDSEGMNIYIRERVEYPLRYQRDLYRIWDSLLEKKEGEGEGEKTSPYSTYLSQLDFILDGGVNGGDGDGFMDVIKSTMGSVMPGIDGISGNDLKKGLAEAMSQPMVKEMFSTFQSVANGQADPSQLISKLKNSPIAAQLPANLLDQVQASMPPPPPPAPSTD